MAKKSPLRKITLKNGLRAILVPSKSVATTVLVLVEAGSEYEKKRQNGLSHFLEHMVFKGTKNRPDPGAISEELDSLGSQYNAFTSQEYTGYWAKAVNKKLPKLIDLISDLHLNPIFRAEEIEKERGVIIEELNMYEDMPMRNVQDVFTDLLYGDQPAGWDVGGTKESVAKLGRKDFVEYRNKHYVASKTIVVVAGQFREKDVERQIKDLFGKLPKKKPVRKKPPKESQKTPKIKAKYKKSDQSHLVLGVRAFPVGDKRRYALNLMAHALGGGMSSRLFKKVREELGAAYYVRAGSSLSTDHGFLSLSAGVNHPKLEEVISAILAECAILRDELIPKAELRRVKDHLIGSVLMGLETSDDLANFYGGQEVMGQDIIDPGTLIKRIEDVTPEEIRQVAKDVFVDKHLNLALIGPRKGTASLKKKLYF